MADEFVVCFGTQYLQCDRHRTSITWVDLAHASLYSRADLEEWTEALVVEARASNKHMHVLSFDEALSRCRAERDERLKRAWLNSFSRLVELTYGGYTLDGLWTNAHMYHSQGLSVIEAVERFGGPGGPRVFKLSGNSAALELMPDGQDEPANAGATSGL